jgi:hypothetical protein
MSAAPGRISRTVFPAIERHHEVNVCSPFEALMDHGSCAKGALDGMRTRLSLVEGEFKEDGSQPRQVTTAAVESAPNFEYWGQDKIRYMPWHVLRYVSKDVLAYCVRSSTVPRMASL